MKLLTTLVDPGYRFDALLPARLLASGLQIGFACGALVLWRRWRARTASMTMY